MFYAVCTKCEFLRAYGSEAGRQAEPPAGCPACGADLVVEKKVERFQPTYVGRVARSLHQAPTLDNLG